MLFGRIENIVGKGENADYPHFPPFPTKFSKAFFLWEVKHHDCVVQSERRLLKIRKWFLLNSLPNDKILD